MAAVEVNGKRRRGAVAARVPFADAVDEREKKPEGDEPAGGKDGERDGPWVEPLHGDVAPDRQSASADDLADRRNEREGQREANAAPEAVGKRVENAVLRGKRLGTAKYDAVHDDQRDEDAERSGEIGKICLHQKVDGRDERRDDDDVAGNVDGGRYYLPQRRDETVGADEDERRRKAHAERVFKTRGNGERRAEPEHKPENGIVLENPVPKRQPCFHTGILYMKTKKMARVNSEVYSKLAFAPGEEPAVAHVA